MSDDKDKVLFLVRLDFREDESEKFTFNNSRFMYEPFVEKAFDVSAGKYKTYVGVSTYSSEEEAEAGYERYKKNVADSIGRYQAEKSKLEEIEFPSRYPMLWREFKRQNMGFSEASAEDYIPKRIQILHCAEKFFIERESVTKKADRGLNVCIAPPGLESRWK